MESMSLQQLRIVEDLLKQIPAVRDAIDYFIDNLYEIVEVE